jgi:hypothetical protein
MSPPKSQSLHLACNGALSLRNATSDCPTTRFGANTAAFPPIPANYIAHVLSLI